MPELNILHRQTVTYEPLKGIKMHYSSGWWITHLPSIVFGCAVNSAGSKMNRVLSTTRVIRSSLTGETVMLEDGSVSLFIWFFAGPSEWCCVRDLHHNTTHIILLLQQCKLLPVITYSKLACCEELCWETAWGLPQGVVAGHLDHLHLVSGLNMASVLMMTHNWNITRWHNVLYMTLVGFHRNTPREKKIIPSLHNSKSLTKRQHINWPHWHPAKCLNQILTTNSTVPSLSRVHIPHLCLLYIWCNPSSWGTYSFPFYLTLKVSILWQNKFDYKKIQF